MIKVQEEKLSPKSFTQKDKDQISRNFKVKQIWLQGNLILVAVGEDAEQRIEQAQRFIKSLLI